MKQEKVNHEEMYYITKVFTSSGDVRPLCREKMESTESHCITSYETALPMQYENGGPEGQIILQYVEEEVSYMADYEADENGDIKQVHYTPVRMASARNNILIIKKKGEAPDTP